MRNITPAAVRIASQGGYSQDRYASWEDVAQALLDEGYSEKEAEAIMRSKWTRWAADHSGQKYGRVTTFAITSYLDNNGYKPGDEKVTELVDMTF